MSAAAAVAFASSTPASTPAQKPRHCIHCDLPISAARLKARPNANACVPCLEIHGDVPTVKSLDANVTTTYTQSNSYIDAHHRRQQHLLTSMPGEQKEPRALIAGYGAASAFEDAMIEIIDNEKKGRKQ